ncbi:MAG: hypothetical protein WBG08_14005, partial [Litorimonas sp.]
MTDTMTTAGTSDAPSGPNWAKRIGLALAALLALLVLLGVGLWLWINSASGRDFVEARVEALTIAGQSVEIDGLDGAVLGGFSVDRIVLSDRDGVWLVAQGLSVDWAPRALLSKTLHVDGMRVDDLDVLRQPVLVSSGASEDPRITTFEIDGFALPDVTLEPPVLGQAVSASAAGQLRHGPDGGRAVLSARSDQGDSVETDLEWSPLLVLSGEADIEGPAGGLLATLLRLDPDQSVSADVATDDSVTRVDADIDGAAFADLAIERGQSSVSVTGTIDPAPVPLLAPLLPYLGGAAQLDAVVPLDQGVPATLGVRAPRLSLDASGTRQDGAVLLSDVSLQMDDPMQAAGPADFFIGRVTAQGRATLDGAYTFEGQAAVSDIAYRDYRVDRLDGPLSLSWAEGRLDFDADMTGTASEGMAARANGAALKAVGQIDLAARSVTLSAANIDLPGLSVRGTGSSVFGDTPTLRFQGRYDIDTTIFRDEPSARLRGTASVESTARGPVMTTSGRATRIEGLADAVAPVAQDGVDYTARLRFADGQVLVPSFSATNDRLEATGTGRWRDGRIEAEVDYRLSEYEFAAVSASDVAGSATLSGPVSDVAFQTDLTVETLQTGALNTTGAVISAQGSYAGGVIETTGTLTAESEQGTVSSSGDIVFQDGAWTVSNLEGSLGDLSATGGLSGIGGDIAALRGDLVLSGTSPLVPAEAIEANIRLGDSRVDVDARLSGLNVWRIEGAEMQITAVGPRDAVEFSLGLEGETQVRDVRRDLSFVATGLADLRQDSLAGTTDYDMTMGRLELAGAAEARRVEAGWAGSLDAQGLGGALALSLS